MDDDTVVLLFVGRFLGFKRVPTLIRAFARARSRFTRPASLVIWGGHPGEWEGEHPVRVADEVGADDIYFVGWRGHEDLPEGLAACDVLVVPSVDDPYPQVPLEAMAVGLPVVACRSGGLRSMVNLDAARPTGWFVPPDDLDALAEALATVVNEPSRAGRAGRQRARVRPSRTVVGRPRPPFRGRLRPSHRTSPTTRSRSRRPADPVKPRETVMPQPRWVPIALIVAATAIATTGVGSAGTTSTTEPTTTSTTVKPGKFPLIAPGGLRPLLKRERKAARQAPATTAPTQAPATTTTIPGTATPYFVGTVYRTFVDPTRGSPARGGTPASSSRTIDTTIYYPTTLAPSEPNPKPRVATGPFPLIVFAHGYEIDAASYAPLLVDLAAGGYVVAAPDFPGTSTAYPGGAIRSDSLQQPGDMSFVITEILAISAQPGLFFNVVDPNAVGDSGQSDGGVTAAAAAFNTCCIDPRIKASVILTGGSFGFDGEWFPPGTPPVMFVHATADEVNPYSASTSMFGQAQSPKYLMTIEGGSHLEVYVDPPWEPHVAEAMIAFFDLYLKADPAAAARLDTAANQPGYALQSG